VKVLDTTVAVDCLRGVPAAADLLADLLGAGEDLVASELVRFELLAGVRKREVRDLEQFCSALTWVPVDEQVARGAALLAGRYRRSHQGVGDADYLIAATAMLLEAELLTTNVRHFPMLESLTPPY
jgi:predicted nucleic acid-binding protein